MEPKKIKVGLLTFGICLISIGIISLLNQYYDAPLFEDYFLLWPIFLIILGLEFILTKLYYDFKKVDVQLSPSVASIFLIILILFVGLAWETFNRLPLDGIWNWNWIDSYNGHRYEYQVTYDYESGPLNVDNPQVLSIDNIRGSIDVQASTGNILEIKARITGTANDKAKANDLLQEVIHINHGSTTAIDIQTPPPAEEISVYEVDFVVYMPATLAVEADTRFGDVKITGIENDVDINNRHGKVYVERIGGKVKIQNEYNDTKVADVKQDLLIRSRHGQVEVDNISGNTDIENEYDDTYCNNIAGDLFIYSRHGSVNLENIEGNITVDNEYEPITLINPSYENSQIKAVVDYNDIIIQGLKDFITETDRNHSEGRAFYGNGDQKIELKSRYGNITIQPTK